MAMSIAGTAGGGPTLWMTIAARDRTSAGFNSAKSNMNKLAGAAVSTMSKIGTLTTSFATLGRVTGMLNDQQARAIGVFGTVMSVFATLGSVIRTLTAIDWAHNVALTWKLSLMTVGIGVAIAAAAAMAVLAMQTEQATVAQRDYNTEVEKGTNAQRRRTANQSIVRRGGYEEVVS